MKAVEYLFDVAELFSDVDPSEKEGAIKSYLDSLHEEDLVKFWNQYAGETCDSPVCENNEELWNKYFVSISDAVMAAWNNDMWSPHDPWVTYDVYLKSSRYARDFIDTEALASYIAKMNV